MWSRKLQVTYTTNAITARVIHFLKHDADASDLGAALFPDFDEGMSLNESREETLGGDVGGADSP